MISLLFSHGSAMGTFLIYYILHLIPLGRLSRCLPDRHPKVDGMTSVYPSFVSGSAVFLCPGLYKYIFHMSTELAAGK